MIQENIEKALVNRLDFNDYMNLCEWIINNRCIKITRKYKL